MRISRIIGSFGIAVFIPALIAAFLASVPAAAQDAAELSVRVNRLENQIRQLSGQIEQLQFENRRIGDQLKRFQEDVEFRLNERGGAARPNAGGGPAAPGATRSLGGGNLDNGGPGSGQPLDVTGTRPSAGGPGPGPRPGPSVATAAGSPREAYDAALAAINGRQFDQAEMGFRQFLQSNPRDRLVPNAVYWLGESYFRRSRHKDAAEQYLKVTTEHAGAAIAPDAMLKLGMSLNALGAREQACATYAQLGVKYPQASGNVRQGVAREQRRSRCDG